MSTIRRRALRHRPPGPSAMAMLRTIDAHPQIGPADAVLMSGITSRQRAWSALATLFDQGLVDGDNPVTAVETTAAGRQLLHGSPARRAVRAHHAA